MKLTPDQINQLSTAIEEVVDSAELQDAELKRVAHQDMLRLSINVVESGTFPFEFILGMAEEAIKGTKIERMAGMEMEDELRQKAIQRGLIKE